MPIYVDADACPVKEEVYRVARRYGIKVFVVANSPIRVPREEIIEFIGVKGGFDAADDWIVERAAAGDIVITADIPLAELLHSSRCEGRGPEGSGIHGGRDRQCHGDPCALDMLRQSDEIFGGPAPFVKADRSRFLSKLDEMIHAISREMNKLMIFNSRPSRLRWRSASPAGSLVGSRRGAWRPCRRPTPRALRPACCPGRDPSRR